ncbi:MAG: hypothetical protein P8X57_14435 [Cyclobacteriaceae bacterium]
MDTNDLQKLRDAWRNEAAFGMDKLTSGEIRQYLTRSSTDIRVLFRKGLLIDLLLKTLLLISLLALVLIFPVQAIAGYVITLSMVLILSIWWQWRILQKIPNPDKENKSVTAGLSEYIQFYYTHYVRSVYVGALSAPIFFIIGSTFYFLFKYQAIPAFQLEDVLVFSSGILLSFGVSLFVQLKFYQFRIGQLENTLLEAEEDSLDEKHFSDQRTQLKKSAILFRVLFIVGLVIFTLLVLFSK